MTDTFPPQLLNGADLRSNPLLPLQHVVTPFLQKTESLDTPVEIHNDDDGQISCFCGINEDDGNTVACDTCNRWQHISCYYPQYADDGNLPEDLQHYCVDCRPRPFDVQAAQIRQQARGHVLQNGVKRPTSKKKRNKDIPVANGWPVDKHRHDRNSASPREQGPPTKRPKTTHRGSNSTSQPPRKRSASAQHHRSASFSPDFTTRTYSPEFIQAYRHDDFTIPDANCLGSLAVGSKLSQWLTDTDEFFRASEGKEQHDLFSRWDGHISTIDYQSDLIEIQEAQDPRVSTDGVPVTWKYATVKEALTQQAFIGELRGTVGLKHDYEADPSNRWSIIRHPEPFVFYYAHLPIYIDTRQEGTVVRYIRRSCNPNAELKIIITGNDYHFCFIATRDIEAGEEVAIAWDCARTMADMMSSRNVEGVSRIDLDELQQWVTTVLSNCGPCACNRVDCLMARFDRRFIGNGQERPKPKVGRKKRGQQISPLNTMVANSRSGSEARKVDPDDEQRADSRSTSGSVGKGSLSRDITPNTHYSANGSLSTLPELSERERKKLAKEEEMFRRQEEQAVGKQTKKKRTSLNTKQSKYVDVNVKRPVKRVKSKTMDSDVTSIKPVYVDAALQCDMDAEEAALKAKSWPSREHRQPRMAYDPLQHRIFQRCQLSNSLWRKCIGTGGTAVDSNKSLISEPVIDGVADKIMTDVDNTIDVGSKSTIAEIDDVGTITSHDQMAEDKDDEIMTNSCVITSSPKDLDLAPNSTDILTTPSNPSAEPPVPPWSSQEEAIEDTTLANAEETSTKLASTRPAKPEEMKLEMPPPIPNPFAMPSLSATTPGSLGTVQSPASLSLQSPSIQSAITPVRKKLSLSDYTRRSKAKETEPKNDRESSPSSIASGPAASTTESKPNGLSVVMEDAQMENTISPTPDMQMLTG